MKDALPPYIVKCFTTAGFDTMQVILKMDVSDEPGNSIEQIERFISDEHPDLLTSKSKKFPPGHRIRIQQFVELYVLRNNHLVEREATVDLKIKLQKEQD